MTAEETEQLLNNIVLGIDTGLSFLGVLNPSLIPLIVIGRAVDKLIPGLAAQVQRWVEGNPPTQAELDEFKAKLATLSDPNLP